MKKQIISIMAVAGLSAASLAGAAEVNIFGASAQFDFLNATAVTFVQQYCGTNTVPADPAGLGTWYQYKTVAGNTIKHGIVTGTNCTINGTSGQTLTLRYSGIASGEGIQAINNAAPLDADLKVGCTGANERRMAKAGAVIPNTDNTTTPVTPYITTADLTSYQALTVCAKVNIGTSDVGYDQFNQVYDNSLLDTVNYINTAATLPTFDAPTATDNSTLAVPFAFYVNPAVTATHCVATYTTGTAGVGAGVVTTPTTLHTGGLCTTSDLSQCATGSVCETTPSTIDNLSRLQANILFSGQITNWNQLGSYFTSKDVKLCFRKPGSGTHVGFDKTVMLAGGNAGWGAGYTIYQNNNSANGVFVNFGGSSTDLKKCITGTDGFALTGVSASGVGAIGYLDADTGNKNTASDAYTKVKYNGVAATRTNLRNGAYEFYTIGHMYADSNALNADVVAFVTDPTKLNLISSKKAFWASINEMKFARGTDILYPSIAAPSAPQTP